MITCIIDGKIAYPDISSKIKYTKENPYIKDRDAWTMEISFPMDIAENAAVFSHVNRLDVSRRVMKYDKCRLYAGNNLIVQGVGVVTQITDTDVRIQIKSGMSMIAYKSEFEKTYIDKIPYDYADPSEYVGVPMDMGALGTFMTSSAVYYIFTPIYDETNDRILNDVELIYKPSLRDVGNDVYLDPFVVDKKAILHKAAIQPNLRFVLHSVLKHMGYHITDMEISQVLDGLEGAYICNTTITTDIAKALPHWTVKRFLDEIRNLYNIAFIFDDATGKVAISHYDPAKCNCASYECVDEFTTEYEEDGLQLIGSSNIKYNLQTSSCRICDDIPAEALDFFVNREYDSFGDMVEAWDDMEEKEKMTTILKCPRGWYYSIKTTNEDEEEYITLHRVGFQHLRRSVDDDDVTLNIVPVPMGECTSKAKVNLQYYPDDISIEEEKRYTVEEAEIYPLYIPFVMEEEKDGDDDYATVQAVVEDNKSIEEEEDEIMQVYYMGDIKDFSFDIGTRPAILENDVVYQIPVSGTFPLATCSTDPWAAPGNGGNRSFAFSNTTAEKYIGMLHSEEKTIENQVMIVIKFISKNIPAPTDIFIFRNKKYICDKIEAEVTHEGIEEIKTGYFYEIK